MSALGRMFARDEELGKKDDDHRPAKGLASLAPWSARKPAQGWRKRRVVYLLCGLLFVYLFVKNIPTDLGPASQRGDIRVPPPPVRQTRFSTGAGGKSRKPPPPSTPSQAEEHYHDGPIKFYKLGASLHAAAKFGGQLQANKNVLFMASSLQSVSQLIPLACEMARWERNDVHLAIMGRDETDLSEIKEVNGAVEDCNVHWHGDEPSCAEDGKDTNRSLRCTSGFCSMEFGLQNGSQRHCKHGPYSDVDPSTDHNHR